MDTLVLTAIGDDRPGLVSALSAQLSAHGASWERSQMARLAGKFAGIVEVLVPGDRAEALVEDLRGLVADGLEVSVTRSDPSGRSAQTGGSGGSAGTAADRWSLNVVGADRPGIVAEISALLSERRISIEELATAVSHAPMAGGMLFEARAVLTAPADAEAGEVRRALEALADELMVEVQLVDEAPAS